jgi:hypothetical protein
VLRRARVGIVALALVTATTSIALGVPSRSLASGPDGSREEPAIASPDASCVSSARPQALEQLMDRTQPGAVGRVTVAGRSLGASDAELRSMARDSSLNVDGCGRVLYRETVDGAVHHDEDPEPPAGLDPFALSSRPGSAHTIYLDFDGETVSDTGWNDMYTGGAPLRLAPFDEDGEPGVSDAEAAKIWAAWATAADTYAAFDVNVTTVDPGWNAIDRSGPGDDRFGIHVVITTQDNPVAEVCVCSGIAYLGSIAASGDYGRLQPALVWTSGEVYPGLTMGNTISHETGHSFGLVHDGHYQDEYYGGFGHYDEHPIDAQWMPIMGAAYGFSQWSNGDYPGATTTQDDVAIIAGNVSMAGDDQPTGSVAGIGVDEPAATGTISSRADTDSFAVDLPAGATYEISASTLQGGSLMQELRVTGPDGSSVGTAYGYVSDMERPPYRTATVRVVVPPAAPGTVPEYVATIDGVPANTLAGSRSDYGSLGGYAIRAHRVDLPTITAVTGTSLTLGEPANGAVVASAEGGTQDRVDTDRNWYFWYVTGDVPGVTLLSNGGPQRRLFAWGTPTAAGTFPVTVEVESPNGERTRADLQVVVSDAPAPPPMGFTTGSRILGQVGGRLHTFLRVQGGEGPYRWTTSGSLPPGTMIRSGHKAEVLLRGRPRKAGRFVFTASVTDAAGQTTSRTFRVRVRRPF